MFYLEATWFYQDFKLTSVFLNLYSVHAERILDLTQEIMLSEKRNIFKTLKTFSPCRNRYNISIF